MKRLNPDANAGGGTPPAPAFDAERFKQEVLEQNKTMIENAVGLLSTKLDSSIEGLKKSQTPPADTGAPSPKSALYSKYAPEMEALGLDDSQTQGILSLIGKAVAEKVPEFKKEIHTEVDEKDALKERKNQYNVDAARRFPDILQASSPLRVEAEKVFAQLSEEEKASPRAMASAVFEAAARLGVAPLTLEQIVTNQAQNPTGGAQGGGTPKGNEPSQKDLDFAAAFDVKPDKFKEKFKIVKAAG